MTLKLSHLHEGFIEQANRPMDLGGPAIRASKPVPIIVPVERWQESEKGLTKRFLFRRPEDRTRFVIDIMEYEDQVQHHAEMVLREGEVTITLLTKDVEKITEMDKEAARFADSAYKDCVFSP
jgi:pterin-4a-carbinolamine dehydratase